MSQLPLTLEDTKNLKKAYEGGNPNWLKVVLELHLLANNNKIPMSVYQKAEESYKSGVEGYMSEELLNLEMITQVIIAWEN